MPYAQLSADSLCLKIKQKRGLAFRAGKKDTQNQVSRSFLDPGQENSRKWLQRYTLARYEAFGIFVEPNKPQARSRYFLQVNYIGEARQVYGLWRIMTGQNWALTHNTVQEE